MKLFDEKVRTYTGANQHAEPMYDYLDRSARPEFIRIRETLEAWFGRYPEGNNKKDLRARFCSEREDQHDAAYFEILMHETLLRLGCKPEPHPELEGRTTRPEFLVHGPSGDFYLEALVVTDESAQEAAARHRLGLVYDEINNIKCRDFAVDLDYDGAPGSLAPIGKWKKTMTRFLQEHTREKVMATPIEERPVIEFKHDGLHLRFRLIPKNYPERVSPHECLIWMTSGPGEYITTWLSIRDKMNEKARKYGKMNLPFVLAVNIKKTVFLRHEIMNALFGEEKLEVIHRRTLAEKPQTRMVRTDGGVWITSKGFPRHKNVSAALVFENAVETTVHVAQGTLFHHPWVETPYTGPLTVFPQMIPGPENRYIEKEGKSLQEIFQEPIGNQDLIPVEFKLGDHLTRALKGD